MSASSGGGGGGRKDEMDYTPLWMSLIAGLSTCLGAAWVLLQRNNSRKRQYNNHINTHNKSAEQQQLFLSFHPLPCVFLWHWQVVLW